MISDAKLVRRTLAGKLEAYETLAERWAAKVVAICHSRTGKADVAEDLAQETLLRGFVALKSLREPQRFGAWMCGIATRVCLDWLKSKKRRQVAFSELGKQWTPEDNMVSRERDATADLENQEEIDKLLSHVEALPESYRTVIMLYYYGEGTYHDVAESLGIAPATVNARLTKGRALLRQRMSASRS